MKQFINQNWVNLVTLLLSALALIISIGSWAAAKESNDISRRASEIALAANEVAVEANEISSQANQIAIESASPLPDIIKDQNRPHPVYVSGCFNSYHSTYEVHHLTLNRITIANRGGRAVSLVSVTFNDGQIEYDRVEIYDRGDWQLSDVEPLQLPLTIEPGRAVAWNFVARYNSLGKEDYPTRETGIAAIDGLMDGQTFFRWDFQFSDGTALSETYPLEWSWHSGYTGSIDTECN